VSNAGFMPILKRQGACIYWVLEKIAMLTTIPERYKRLSKMALALITKSPRLRDLGILGLIGRYQSALGR
jgi:hypothetical protein